MELPREKHTARVLELLDSGAGKCHLRNPAIAKIVQDNLLHFDAQKYELFAWVVMPNHVHSLIRCLPGNQLPEIVHSWKSYTAKKANEILLRRGQFWQPDYFDRCPRSHDELIATAMYIEHNPVAAGLVAKPEDWPFSSAGYRGAHCW